MFDNVNGCVFVNMVMCLVMCLLIVFDNVDGYVFVNVVMCLLISSCICVYLYNLYDDVSCRILYF